MRAARALVFVAVAAVSAVAAGVIVARCGGREPGPPARDDAARLDGSGARVDGGTAGEPRPPWRPPGSLDGGPGPGPGAADAGEARGVDELPTIAELDKEYGGIAEAHRAARDAVMAEVLARQQRRCFRKHRGELDAIEWIGVETYTVDGGGVARLSSYTAVPANLASAAATEFLACITEGVAGKIELRVPGLPAGTFTVREGGGQMSRVDLTPRQIAEELASLRERIAAPGISEAQRKLLEQHLALWQCYQARGLGKRDECQRELDGE